MQYGYQPQYEFNPAQNAVIGKLASRMRLAGIVQLVFGVADFFGSCQLERSESSVSLTTTSSPFDIALIISAIFMITAASSFGKIVATQGWDVSHLLVGLRSYSRSVLVQFITYVIMAVLFAIGVALLLVLLLLFASVLESLKHA